MLVIYFHFTLGAFEDPDIIHVDDTVDPVRDLEIISEELRLKVQIICFLNYWFLVLLKLTRVICFQFFA